MPKRKIFKQLDLPEYKQDLKGVVKFLDNLSYSAVKTKYNKKGSSYSLVHLNSAGSTSDFRTPGFRILPISSEYPLIDIASQLPFALYFVFTAE